MALQPLVRDYGGGVVRANAYRDNGRRGTQWVERGAEGEIIEQDRMEGDTELEEGETVEGEHRVADLDLPELGYIDKKLEQVLGDCQKEFQGSLFADKLGSKVGIYGSFLPTHVRGAPVLGAPPQGPAGMPRRPRLLEEREQRRVSGNGVPDRAAKVSPNGTGIKGHAQVNGVNHSGDGHGNLPVKSNKRKGTGSLTVRINLNKGANKVGKKTIYNGFGLDNSSSPSSDEYPEGAPSASEESSPDRSPCSMIQIITSHFVPGDGLLSPLAAINWHSTRAERKEKPLVNAKGSKKLATGSSAEKQELGPGPVAAEHDNDFRKDPKAAKEKIEKFSEKVEKLHGKPAVRREEQELGPGPVAAEHDDDVGIDAKVVKENLQISGKSVVRREVPPLLDSGWAVKKDLENSGWVVKKDLENDGRTGKEGGGNGPKVSYKESSKIKRKISGNKDTVKAKWEEEAPQKESQKQQNRKDGKHVEPAVVERDTAKDDILAVSEVVKVKGKESSKGPQMHKESKIKAKDALRDARRESKKESSKKEVLRDFEESVKEEPKESSKASVRDIPTEPPKDGGKREGTDQGLKDVKAGKKAGKKGVKEPKSSSKVIERDTGVHGDLLGPVADSTGAQPLLTPLPAGPVADATAGTVLPLVQPVLVLDHWVQCDNCQQWRLLAPSVHPDDLPDNWLCKMMDWLPGLNNCKNTEEETTGAVYKQLGLQNPLQAQQQGLAPGLAPAPGLIPDNKILVSKPVKVSRSASKKGMGKKPVAGTVRNTTSNVKRMQANAVKSRSLNDVGQHPGDQVADTAGLEAIAPEDVGYGQVAVDSAGGKRKKKPESSEENDDLRSAKKSKVEDKEVIVKVKLRQGDGKRDSKKRMRGDDIEPGHQVERKRVISKPESKDWGASRETLREENLPGVETYNEQSGGQQKGGSQLRSPPSSSSKVSFSAETSAFGSKGGSPIESTVSSSPVRSSKVDRAGSGRGLSEGLQNNHTTAHSQPSDRYGTSNRREGADFRKYDRSRGGRDDCWEEGRETRAGSTDHFAERGYDRHRDERYREREDSADRYRDRENRYDRRSSREDRFRDRDRERDRSRENWTNDRSGDVREKEERYSRERSVRQDRGGRPSSRESRLDKQGSWHDESKSVRDVGREWRDRVDDENPEIKHEMRPNHVEGLKEDHSGEDEHDAAPHVQKDDVDHRHEKTELGPPKDAKPSFLRAPPPGQASHGWDGEKVGVAFSGRKDSDADVPRNGLETQTTTTHVNSRSRIDGMQSGQGSTGLRGKLGQVDGAPLDVRIVEDAKHKKVADEPISRVCASKALITRNTEGASASLSKKEHHSLGKTLTQEGAHLKHSADRLKIVASSEAEIPNLYLQASLKFLQAAHHFEMAAMEEGRDIKLYHDTALLFDYCASTYERQRDHAAGALAHNCAAVARFHAVMTKSGSLNKDCLELKHAASLTPASGVQVAGVLTPPPGLPPPPPPSGRTSEKPRSSHGIGVVSTIGESPSSSSASDVDNLNNHALIVAGEKGVTAIAVKGVAPSPTVGSVSGSTELVPQRLHGAFNRTIRNGMDLAAMMDSWTKARNATAAMEAACAGVPGQQEGMIAVRRVVEIGLLGNMDAVVRQVRIALEAIGH